MKKILAIATAAAFALTLCTGVFAAETNLALTATVTDDGNENHFDQYEYGTGCVVDGNLSTGWQKSGNAGEGNTWIASERGFEPYLNFEWDTATNISEFVLKNESSNIVKPFADSGYKVEYYDGTQWRSVTGLTESRAEDTGTKITTLTVKFDAVSAKQLRFTVLEGLDAGKYPPKVYEFEIYYSGAPIEPPAQTGVEVAAVWVIVFAAAAVAAAFTVRKRAAQ